MTEEKQNRPVRLHERLRALRKKSAKTLREIGHQAGLSISYMSDIERGRTLPSLETCQRLASVYGMSLSTLFKHVEVKQ